VAEIYWPAGVGDDPLLDMGWEPVENGEAFSAREGQFRQAPVNLGTSVLITPTYPMSNHQFYGLWLPWWNARKVNGGCEQGMVAFWLRDPDSRVPMRFMRVHGQKINRVRDGQVGFLVTLPLVRLPA
jgi:hypothetical protein